MKSNENELIAHFYKLLKSAENKLSAIVPDALEQKIFDILSQVASELPQKPTLRVAGGWVRDKLLGKNNKDIDFTVDNMTGLAFAEATVKWMKQHGYETSSVGEIKENPDQSKNLATATTFIMGLPIDFAQLRKETYDSDSRIPNINVGTPEEDARRRDLTINSLYYNLKTNKLEDFTGNGVADLKSGIIRTPLEPKLTFMEDPLRMLRAIRFSSRFGFTIDPAVREAFKSPEIKEAFKNKVTRERVAEELRGMLKGPNPAGALELITELGLRDDVFTRPEGLREWEMDQNNPHHELNLYEHLIKVVRSMSGLLKKPGHDVEQKDRIILLLAAFFHDMGKFEPSVHGVKQLEDKVVSTYYGHEAHSKRIAQHIMKELKMSNDEIDGVLRLIEPAGNVENMVRAMENGQSPTRKALGRLVQLLGDSWKHAVYLAMADEASKKKDGPDLDENEIGSHYKFLDLIQNDKAVANAHKTKPLLNGNEIAELMNMKPGPALGVATRALNEWHLANLEATKQDAIDFIKKEFAGKTEEDLSALSPYKKKKSSREDRLKRLAEIIGHLAIFDHYLFLPVQPPILSTKEQALLSGLKTRGEYHITIINAEEIASLPPDTFEKDTRYEITGEPIQRGLGKAEQGKDVVYFIVVDWPEAQKFRAQFGLPPRDFHITMGFSNKDIHNVRKNNVLSEVYKTDEKN